MQSDFVLSPILLFVSFLLALVSASIIKKIYYRIRYQKRFYILPRVSVKGIASIAMIIAISIAIIILLTVITADLFSVVFRAWPGTRVTIEGILIKIGGLLFGPYLGIFIGGMTDLLSVALTAGVFHYGYLIAAMAYGLISGLIAEIFRYSKRKNYQYAIWSTIILFITLIITMWFIFQQSEYGSIDYSISFLNIDINLKSYMLMFIIGVFIVVGIFVIWLSLLIYQTRRHKHKLLLTTRQKDNEKHWYYYLSMILVTSIVCNALVNVLMMPTFDAELSSLNNIQWITIRGVLFIPEVILNLAIIFPIFKIVSPLINYDYHDDMIEDWNRLVYVE